MIFGGINWCCDYIAVSYHYCDASGICILGAHDRTSN